MENFVLPENIKDLSQEQYHELAKYALNQRGAGNKEPWRQMRSRTSEWLNGRSPLSFTWYEHTIMGSTVSAKMAEEPDKPKVDFLSDEEVERELDNYVKFLPELLQHAKDGQQGVQSFVNDFKLAFPYLASIGRLPKKYQDFDYEAFLEKLEVECQNEE
ncbi:MAG: hypothetical protein UT66_C0018G0004 [candidate division CPR2 bacterium GW2011_GWC1_39_9]|uniref:Uncharacterized protein n=1 Tax=candidate division CPR2 bacterium GW2011_GWC2_39_10 TaxID=1618345 RepID=A0A0G0LQ02_UNCC2|nr:MAG: hypothetical protein UT18_C0013G0030 [candidate division CPR2 bacterium GW2011_GWC2_39_10]KKR34665.1 MAG: hypothetical protein UT66_C0018G0004 [candidate division CPR2 bacterium GW2011_GWC1_39_9]